jgi:hypothetical protein
MNQVKRKNTCTLSTIQKQKLDTITSRGIDFDDDMIIFDILQLNDASILECFLNSNKFTKDALDISLYTYVYNHNIFNYHLVDILFKYGADTNYDIEAIDGSICTSYLCVSIQNQNVEMFKYFKDKVDLSGFENIDEILVIEDGISVFDSGIIDYKFTSRVFQYFFSQNLRFNGNSLHSAVVNKQKKLVKLLLSFNSPIHIKSFVLCQDLDIFKLILNSYPNTQVLHNVVQYSISIDILFYILKNYGSGNYYSRDIFIRSITNEIGKLYPILVYILENNLVNVSTLEKENSFIKNVLLQSFRLKNTEFITKVIRLLISNGAKLETNILEYAIKYGNKDVLFILIKSGVKPRDNDIELASRIGEKDIFKLLVSTFPKKSSNPTIPSEEARVLKIGWENSYTGDNTNKVQEYLKDLQSSNKSGLYPGKIPVELLYLSQKFLG